ncbi:MAG: PAS domain S-box protein [Calditrichia bacterium]
MIRPFRLLKTLAVVLLLQLLISSKLTAQQEHGSPFLQTYSPREYRAHAQNWAVVQDKRGVMFFGNTAGVLEYDGVNWRLHSLPNRSVARTLAIDETGRLFVGAHSDFGYLKADSLGQFHYKSLLNLVNEQNLQFGNIWKVHILPGRTIFRGSSHIFILEGDSLTTLKPSTRFHRSFTVNTDFYVREREVGLKRLNGGRLELIENGEHFATQLVDMLLPLGQKLLVGGRNNALELYDRGNITAFPTEIDDLLQESEIYDAVLQPNNTIAIATLRGGLALIDSSGKLITRLDNTTGLNDNTIWGLGNDMQGGLWLAQNNGIVRVEANSQLSVLSKTYGLTGNVEAVVRFKGTLYAATNAGLFYLNETQPGQSPQFARVDGISTQTWDLLSTGEFLLVATSDGVFQVSASGSAIQQLNKEPTFCLSRIDVNLNLIWIGMANGLAQLREGKSGWQFVKKVEGFKREVRSITRDKSDALWLGSQFQGVSMASYSSLVRHVATPKTPAVFKSYNQSAKLPEGEVNTYTIAGEVYFATGKGLRYFDGGKEHFLPATDLVEAADSTFAIHRVAEDHAGRVWIERGKPLENFIEICVLQKNVKRAWSWSGTPLSRAADYFSIWDIYPDPTDENIVWFGGTEGLIRYEVAEAGKERAPFNALIRQVTLQQDSILFAGNKNESSVVLEYGPNPLRFEFAATAYDNPDGNSYHYFLEGFDHEPSQWTSVTQRDYTNLREGDYRFSVTAKDIYGNISSADSFRFKIRPPWYRSYWFYFLAFATTFTLLYTLFMIAAELIRKREKELAKLRETELTLEKNHELAQKNDQLSTLLSELKRSKNLFQSVTESANDAIITADANGNITLWNRRAETIFGYKTDEILGQPITILMPERYREKHEIGLQEFVETGRGRLIGGIAEMHGLRQDGSEFPLELSLAAWDADEGRYITGIVRDITRRVERHAELERTQTLLFQSEKMASIGKLTAGIAHEINTPIGAIRSSADTSIRSSERLEATLNSVVDSDIPLTPKHFGKYLTILKNNSELMTNAGERVSKLLERLKNFSRLDEAPQQMANLHEGINSTLALLDQDLEHITIEKLFGDIPDFYCHPGELNQVFMHLLSNAVQAIKGNGTITIHTAEEDNNINISIKDTGCGIPADQIKNLFEAGFQQQDGRIKAGMGLFISQSIVHRHFGKILVKSNPNIGSTFIIVLPTQNTPENPEQE